MTPSIISDTYVHVNSTDGIRIGRLYTAAQVFHFHGTVKLRANDVLSIRGEQGGVGYDNNSTTHYITIYQVH